MASSRPLKFRAWDGQKMHDSPPMHEEWGSLNYAIDDCIQHGQTLMQYTNLEDKDGVEIYEGDVVSVPIDGVGVVRWHEVGWEVRGDNWVYTPLEIKKVLGNIWENPGILEEK